MIIDHNGKSKPIVLINLISENASLYNIICISEDLKIDIVVFIG